MSFVDVGVGVIQFLPFFGLLEFGDLLYVDWVGVICVSLIFSGFLGGLELRFCFGFGFAVGLDRWFVFISLLHCFCFT